MKETVPHVCFHLQALGLELTVKYCVTNTTFLRAFTLTIVLTNQMKWMSSYTLK